MELFFYGRSFVGCDDYVAEQQLSFYPNPVVDMLYTSEDGLFSVKDLMGRTLFSGEMSNGAVDLSSLPAGVYIFSLENGKGVKTARIVKK